MAGRSNWLPLDELEMKDLSSNNGLCYYYELSQCANLSQFLSLGEKRYQIRDYWEGSEKRLEEVLTHYFESQIPKEATKGNPPVDEEETNFTYGQVLEDPTSPCQHTAAPVATIPSNEVVILTESPLTALERETALELAQRQQLIATQLLYGSVTWTAFDEMSISDITQHPALKKFYSRVDAKNLSELLALGRKRISYPGYGTSTEKKLREAVLNYIKTHSVQGKTLTGPAKQDDTIVEEVKELSEHIPEAPIDSTATPQEIEAFVEDLLSGTQSWAAFDEEHITTITRNIALRIFYNASKCANLSEFLSLSKKRLHIRKYWTKDELLLKKELIQFFKSRQLRQVLGATSGDHTTKKFEQIESVISEVLVSSEHKNLPSSPAVEETPTVIPQKEMQQEKPTPAAKNEEQKRPTEPAKSLARKLLSGDIHLAAFDNLSISDISDNVRLNNVYNFSGVRNLTDFLALGDQRMQFKNYGKRTEMTLKDGISSYLGKHFEKTQDSSGVIQPKDITSTPTVRFDDKEVDRILHSENPEKLIDQITWRNCKQAQEGRRVWQHQLRPYQFGWNRDDRPLPGVNGSLK